MRWSLRERKEPAAEVLAKFASAASTPRFRAMMLTMSFAKPAKQMVSIMSTLDEILNPSISAQKKAELAGQIWHTLKEVRSELDSFKQAFAKEYGELIGDALAAEKEGE